MTLRVDNGAGIVAESNVFAVQAGPVASLPGEHDRFAADPRRAVPRPATLTALDAHGYTVTNYSGSANLGVLANLGEVSSQTIFPGSPIPTSNGSGGTWTDGYSFTPSSNFQVTAVRHYFGTKVSIWTDSGTLLASQTYTDSPGSWSETSLSSPIKLQAGVTYRVGVDNGGQTYYWRTDMSSASPVGTINAGYQISGDTFPRTRTP